MKKACNSSSTEDKKDAKRKFWQSPFKGPKDQGSKEKEDYLTSTRTDSVSAFVDGGRRRFEADIFREILDALPTVRTPLEDVKIKTRGKLERDDSGFDGSSSGSQTSLDQPQDSDDVGDGTLITRDELVEDVHDLKVVKVAQQLRKPHSGLMTPAHVGQRVRTSSAPLPGELARRRLQHELPQRCRRNTTTIETETSRSRRSGDRDPRVRLGTMRSVELTRYWVDRHDNADTTSEVPSSRDETNQLYLLMPLLL